MAIEIVMPKLGLTMKLGRVAKWLKKEGDPVKKGEPVAEVMTDKIANVLEAPGDGVLLKIIAQVGASLSIGGLMGFIGAAGEKVPDAAGAAAPVPTPSAAAPSTPAPSVTVQAKGVKATPVAKRLAQEHGIDLSLLVGTGPGGSIVREDVEKAVAEGVKAPRVGGVKATPVAKKLAQQHGIDLSLLVGTGPGGSIVREDVERAVAEGVKPPALSPVADLVPGAPEIFEVIPYVGIRQIVGENMLRSWAEAPKVDQHTTADMTELLAARKAINAELTEDKKVTVTDLLVLIVSRALERKRLLNSALEPDGIKVFRNVNMGVAIALENALVVPVIHNANRKTLGEISTELKDLSVRAKEGRLTEMDYFGGTFTLTNLGGYRSTDHFTPVINPPQAAILGVGRTKEVPVVVNGQVCIRPIVSLSLAHDHRIVDGAPAAEFLSILIRMIESPCLAL